MNTQIWLCSETGIIRSYIIIYSHIWAYILLCLNTLIWSNFEKCPVWSYINSHNCIQSNLSLYTWSYMIISFHIWLILQYQLLFRNLYTHVLLALNIYDLTWLYMITYVFQYFLIICDHIWHYGESLLISYLKLL